MSDQPVIQFKELLSAPPEYGANASAIEYDSDNPRYLRITDIGDDGALLYTDSKSIPRYIAEPYLLQEDDITIARTGNTVGKAYLYKSKDGEIAFAGYLIRFKIDGDKADPEFVFQFLHSPYYYSWIERTLRTGAQPNINATEYCSMFLPDFKLHQQKKIAKILTTIDQLIENTQALIGKHTDIKQGMMSDLYTRGIDPTTGQLRPSVEQAPHLYKETELGWVPREWEILTIGDALERGNILLIQDGNHGEVYPRNSDFSDTGIPFLSAKHIDVYGDIDFEICPKLPDSYIKKLRIGFGNHGDIVFAHNATVGPVGLVENVTEYIASTSTTIYRSGSNIINLYLFYFMRSIVFQNQIQRVMGQTTRNQVPIGAQKELHMVMPPINEQNSIVNRLSSMTKKLKDEKRFLEKYQAIKSGLMQDLLTGRVSIHND